jgi:16S rRNA (guanine966-N2)-methyltransferase
MRVIAGTFKGRRLAAPTWEGLRPTSDRLRETLFNVLAPRLAGARVLDGFAGTGALGIEALSRGAAEVTFIESDARAQALLSGNLAQCGIETGYTMIRAPVARGLEMLRADPAFVPFDIVLFDPPYDAADEGVLAGADAVLATDGVLVLEHARRRTVPASAGRLVRVRHMRSGDSALSLYALAVERR